MTPVSFITELCPERPRKGRGHPGEWRPRWTAASRMTVAQQRRQSPPRLVGARWPAGRCRLSRASSRPTWRRATPARTRPSRLWPASVAGWKVGKIARRHRDGSGEDRLVGPIFSRACAARRTTSLEFPVIDGGFAAVEAEYIFRAGRDAPAGKTDWSASEAAGPGGCTARRRRNRGQPAGRHQPLGPRGGGVRFRQQCRPDAGPGNSPTGSSDARPANCAAKPVIEGVSVGSGGARSVPGGCWRRWRSRWAAAPAAALRACVRALLSPPARPPASTTSWPARRRASSFAGIGGIECRAVPARPDRGGRHERPSPLPGSHWLPPARGASRRAPWHRGASAHRNRRARQGLPDGQSGAVDRRAPRARDRRPLSIRQYHSGQLGRESEAIDMARFGAIDITRVYTGATQQCLPADPGAVPAVCVRLGRAPAPCRWTATSARRC